MAVNVLTNRLKILHIIKRDFVPTQLLLQGSVNMLKVQPFRFGECLCTFAIFLVEVYSEALLF